MPAGYAALPNPRTTLGDVDDEMEAAFDDSDDDEGQSESRPLNPINTSVPYAPVPAPLPGTYDFENVDYDYPPPGSPPRRDRALPGNDLGNTNGLIPAAAGPVSGPRIGWLSRTAGALLPTHYAQRMGLGRPQVSGAVGSGLRNDGVFANVTAKPTPSRQIVDGEEVHVMPEDAAKDAPPSYASAQADSVPPYWETTVHAPSTGGAGEMIHDGLPTGAVFSFLWNMLVSISFQFVGFLLTYLLHTTHAAKFGSRAGLGLTLIQYGFALRTNGDAPMEPGGGEGGMWAGHGAAPPARPSFETAAEAEAWYASHPNATAPSMPMEIDGAIMGDLASEWLSFLLMTVGWFVLLTSLLGFWRVKRWERSIIASNRAPNPGSTGAADGSMFSNFENVFNLRINRAMVRQGLGFSRGRSRAEGDAVNVEDELILPPDATEPERARMIADAYANERRLHDDLRAAGLL